MHRLSGGGGAIWLGKFKILLQIFCGLALVFSTGLGSLMDFFYFYYGEVSLSM